MHPVHRSGVIRGQFRFQFDQVRHTGLVSRVQVAGCCEIQHDIAFFANQFHRFAEFFLAHRSFACIVAHMQMSDTSTGLPALIYVFGNFFRCHRNIGIVLLGWPGAGRRHRDDYLVHVFLPPCLSPDTLSFISQLPIIATFVPTKSITAKIRKNP